MDRQISFVSTASTAIVLGLIVVASAAPSLGPSWHQTTVVGFAMGTPLVRLGLGALALLALFAALKAWRVCDLGDKVALVLAAMMPLLLALSPAPVLTTDGALLRSTDPVHDIDLFGPDAALPPAPLMAPLHVVWALQGAREDEALVRVARVLEAASSASSVDTADLMALEEQLEKTKATFQSESCLTLPSTLLRNRTFGVLNDSVRFNNSGEPVIDKACERRVEAHNATVRAKIEDIAAQINGRKAELEAFAVQSEDLEMHRRVQGVLRAQQAAVSWSRLITLGVMLAAVGVMLFSSFGAGVAIALPMIGVPIWLSQARITAEGFATTIESVTLLANIATVEVLLIGAIALRMFVSSNSDIWRKLRVKEASGLFATTFFYWLPLGACVAVATWTGLRITEAELDLVYQFDFPVEQGQTLPPVDPKACDAETPRLLYMQEPFCKETDRTLERDLRTSMRYWFDLAEREMVGQTEAAQLTADAAADRAIIVALERFDLTIPPRLRQNETNGARGLSPAFNLPKCKWYQFLCHAKRRALKSMDRSYVSLRKDLREDFEAKVTTAVVESDNFAQAAGDSAKGNMPLIMDRIEMEMTRTIWSGFRTMEVLSALSQLLAIIAILKSFGFVLGRVMFSNDKLSRKISLGRNKSGGINAEQIEISGSGGLRLGRSGLYRVVMGADVDGVAPCGLRLVQPLQQTVKRLLPFRHLFQSFDLDLTNRDVTLPCGNVHRIIAIPLQSGERIGYFPKYLHGFCGTPVFHSRWSFRIAHLIQGRIRICTITGPCTVFLRSSEGPQVLTATTITSETKPVANHFASTLEIRLPDGEASDTLKINHPCTIKIDSAEAGRSDMSRSDGIFPGRLMAWSDGLDLDVSGGAGWTDIYTGSIRVKPYGSGVAVFDGPTGRNRFGGALTFIPGLFLPL